MKNTKKISIPYYPVHTRGILIFLIWYARNKKFMNTYLGAQYI